MEFQSFSFAYGMAILVCQCHNKQLFCNSYNINVKANWCHWWPSNYNWIFSCHAAKYWLATLPTDLRNPYYINGIYCSVYFAVMITMARGIIVSRMHYEASHLLSISLGYGLYILCCRVHFLCSCVEHFATTNLECVSTWEMGFQLILCARHAAL